ncbi:MAG TPA: class I SAM-dependent methyltransferase [Tepidisphaeraceae bacterium]|nr:class I SAM-dependent methyltransferase [Tepidisphaeraceae bacterium]
MLAVHEQPCCVCGENNSRLFHEAIYPEHNYPGTFFLRKCEGCGLLFNSPRLDDVELANLYGSNYYFFRRNDSRELERIVGMYQRTIGLIDGDLDDRRSIDIGTGRGYLPAVLKELGWQARGIELSADAAGYARSEFLLDIFTGTVEQYAASPDAKVFPVVTAIDVIEHVPSPGAFIEAIAKVLTGGGYLIIDTPNALADNITLKKTAWKGFNPFHIYLFSIDTLTALLSRYGLKVERSFSYGNTPTPRDFRDRMASFIRKTPLARKAAEIYFSGRDKGDVARSPRSGVEAAAAKVRSAPKYTSTPDATAPLAASKTGDNIVVIARKG